MTLKKQYMIPKFLFFLKKMLQIERVFLVILTFNNSKTTCCDRQKPIVDMESTSKSTSIKKIHVINEPLPKLTSDLDFAGQNTLS